MNQSVRFPDPRANYGLPYTARSRRTSNYPRLAHPEAETLARRPESSRRRAFRLTSGVDARIASAHDVAIADPRAFQSYPDGLGEWTSFDAYESAGGSPFGVVGVKLRDAFTGDDSGYRHVDADDGEEWGDESVSVGGPRISRSAVMIAAMTGFTIATAIIGVTLRFAGPSTIISAALLLVGAGIALFVQNRAQRA